MPNNNKDCGFFGPNSHMWQNNQYFIRVIFYPAAVVMVMSHPVIAEILLQETLSLESLKKRLSITRQYSFNFIFGDKKTALTASANLKKIHQQIHHNIDGKTYCALDPELMLWVFGSVYYIHKKINKTLLRNTHFNQDTYVEYKILAQLYGIDLKDLPETAEDFDKYWSLALQKQISTADKTQNFINSCFQISATDFYFKHKTPCYLRFISKKIDRFIKIFTIYYLPEQLASALNLKISTKQQKRITQLMQCVKWLHSILPKWVTVSKNVRQALRCKLSTPPNT